MINEKNLYSSFPPLEKALDDPNGLLAVGGDLSPQRLIEAYRSGIFPWFNEDEPIFWWSPDPRMVLFPGELKISRSLRKTLHKNCYQIRADTAFTQVMQACAAPRKGQSGTWIHPEMIAAYTALHGMGLAHSVETWTTASWLAVSTALLWEKCFSANRCFRAALTHRKLPSYIW